MEIATSTWESLHGELVKFVHKKVKDRAAAEDIVQDVFIKVHTKSTQLKEAHKLSGWIYQITRNAVADHFRKNAKAVESVNIDWESDYHEFNDCVSDCLSQLLITLPEKYRSALHLAEVENLSQYEIAERLGITYPGARSRVQRARKMLRDKLEALYVIKTDAYGNVIICENRNGCMPGRC